MKVLFIESRLKRSEQLLNNKDISKLPKELFLAYSIQYKSLAESIKKQLEKNKIKVKEFRQVLGCSKIDSKVPVLLIGSGRFHASNLYLQAPQIFVLEGETLIEIDSSEIEKIKNRRKTALLKFLHAEKIGILVTTKPGQENLNLAITLKNNLNKSGKKAYIFVANNLDISQFENFNIDSWVNTACIGLALDNPQIINVSELPIPIQST